MNKRAFITQIILFLIWLAIVVFTGINHEPWHDEAQGWLIARDCSYTDMILNVLKYEGHPVLWYFLLRPLILAKFPYDLFFIIPVFLSGLGVFLLLFKTKLPSVIKFLFPFTFFIIYQNTVIARSYSMLLPLLMLLVIFHKERIKKPLFYTFLLIVFMCAESYNLILSGILFLFFLYDTWAAKKFNSEMIWAIVLYSVCAISTILYLRIPPDYSNLLPTLHITFKKFILVYLNGYYDIFNDKISFYKLLLPLGMYISAMLLFCKNIRQYLFFISLNLGILIIMSMITNRYWHHGYIITLFVFTIAILCEENLSAEYPKYLKTLFISLFSALATIQIFWGINAVVFDINNNYSAGKDIANFIKVNKLDKDCIGGLGYLTDVLPYFDRNIYCNYKTTYYKFQKSAELELFEKGRQPASVIIYDPSFNNVFEDYVESLQGYKIFTFYDSLRRKSQITKSFNSFVMVKEDLLQQ